MLLSGPLYWAVSGTAPTGLTAIVAAVAAMFHRTVLPMGAAAVIALPVCVLVADKGGLRPQHDHTRRGGGENQRIRYA
jgi:hypothetical protein